MEEIEIVTALGQNHRRGFRVVSPISPHIGMRVMEILHLFGAFEENEIADDPTFEQFFQFDERRGVAENMADDDLFPIDFCGLLQS